MVDQPRPRKLNNLLIPPEGPKGLPIVCDFAAVTSVTINLSQNTQNQDVSWIQSVFVDNGLNNATLSLSVTSTGQVLRIPPLSQAYLPIMVANPPEITAACMGGQVSTVTFLNIPFPAAVWSGVDGGGGGGGTSTDIVPGGVDLVSFGTSTVATTSTQLMPADANRNYILICAPQAADIWLNIIGGTADNDGADCFKLAAGTFYETNSAAWKGQINYWCGSAGDNLTAFSGMGS